MCLARLTFHVTITVFGKLQLVPNPQKLLTETLRQPKTTFCLITHFVIVTFQANFAAGTATTPDQKPRLSQYTDVNKQLS